MVNKPQTIARLTVYSYFLLGYEYGSKQKHTFSFIQKYDYNDHRSFCFIGFMVMQSGYSERVFRLTYFWSVDIIRGGGFH